MTRDPALTLQLPPWRWILTGWAIVALAWAPASMLVNADEPSWAALGQSFFAMALNFAVWAAATPLLLRLCAAWPLDEKHAVRNAALLLLVGVLIVPLITSVFPLLQLLGGALAGANLPSQAYDLLRQGQRVLITSLFAVPTYLAVIAIGQTLVWAAKARTRAAEAAGAEMRALRAELNPHLLFNTLGAIGRLAHAAPERAERAVASLSEVLRNSLAETGPTQTLAEAVGEAEEHLALYRMLHGDVRFDRDVPADVWRAELPARLLVPLVENAMTHGARDRTGARWLVLRVRKSEPGQLVLELSNPLPASAPPSRGLGSGLDTARRLLAIHHGESARLEHEVGDGRFLVRINLPA